MSEQEIKRLKWRIYQQRRRERLYRERGPRIQAMTADAIYMRGYRRGIRKRARV